MLPTLPYVLKPRDLQLILQASRVISGNDIGQLAQTALLAIDPVRECEEGSCTRVQFLGFRV